MTVLTSIPELVGRGGQWAHSFSYHAFDIELAKAEGVYLIDTKGNRYIDASGGAMAVSIGHGNPRVKQAVADQMQQYAYVHPAMANAKRGELADLIAGIAPSSLNTVQLASGGSEAVETAIKIARQFHEASGSHGKYKIISWNNSYHGMTVTTMGMAGNESYRASFGAMLTEWPHFDQYSECDRPEAVSREEWANLCARRLETTILAAGPDTVAAFIATPHGCGPDYGLVPPANYWPEIRRICDAYNVLLIADEVVTGFGRTGKWFALEHFGVEADLITFAKGVSSSNLPLGGVIVSDRVNAPFLAGANFLHGFTNQGNAVACAAGMAVIGVLSDVVDKVQGLSEVLFSYQEQLLARPGITAVRGWGLFMSVELARSKEPGDFFPPQARAELTLQAIALKHGLVFYTTLWAATAAVGPNPPKVGKRGAALRFAPPLTITADEIHLMMTRFDAALDEWELVMGLSPANQTKVA